MSNDGDDDLSALVARAAEASKAAPEALRSSAFEVVLKALIEAEKAAPSPTRRRTGKRTPQKRKAPAAKAKKATTAAGSSDAPSKATKKARKGGGSRPGPRAAIEQLIESGFLKTPKTNKAMREELRHARGFGYAATDLSPALVRLLRDGVLTREKNADGQYEFRSA